MASSRDFVALGDIRGQPIETIIKRVGPPSSISATSNGSLYQWISAGVFGGIHYAISVDLRGNAIGYTHQFSRGGWVGQLAVMTIGSFVRIVSGFLALAFGVLALSGITAMFGPESGRGIGLSTALVCGAICLLFGWIAFRKRRKALPLSAAHAEPVASKVEPVPASSVQFVAAELNALADLRDRGALTEDEFQRQKLRILGQ